MVFAAVKKDDAGKRNRKHLEERKGMKLKIMPPCEELRGDSPSGLSLFGGCLTATQSVALV